MMCSNTIFLCNGHIHQLIISIWLNKVQAFLELSIEATTKTVALLDVSIRMMARVLAKMIEDLCILKNSAGPLIQSQEFIQLLWRNHPKILGPGALIFVAKHLQPKLALTGSSSSEASIKATLFQDRQTTLTRR